MVDVFVFIGIFIFEVVINSVGTVVDVGEKPVADISILFEELVLDWF